MIRIGRRAPRLGSFVLGLASDRLHCTQAALETGSHPIHKVAPDQIPILGEELADALDRLELRALLLGVPLPVLSLDVERKLVLATVPREHCKHFELADPAQTGRIFPLGRW